MLTGHRLPVLIVSLSMLLATPPRVAAQNRGAQTGSIPSIEEKTAGMRKLDGFFPLFWDEASGKLWLEIARFDTEVLHVAGLAAGIGSNDIGLDRGQLRGSRIVEFERVGPRVLMVQPNYEFRATSDNSAEVRAVRDAFARSVLWGFPVAAQTGERVLVDLTDYLMTDQSGIGDQIRPGQYRIDESRSAVYLPMTLNFPENTEMEIELTFTRRQPGRADGFFEGVGSVAATSEAATVRVHYSLVELPDGSYTPRLYDPRSGFFPFSYRDYAAPLDQPMTRRLISRHRLEKRDPAARVSEPVKPITYYVDPGTPEPIRSALMEGARWWNQAFEAAGYRNAFRVELLPEGASPLDIRYNVINWVHRSTRGWSYGRSVEDPRTGEIIKGVVTLGSLRIRQDILIAEGLLAPYTTGDETPPELAEWGLARIRQLSAHEVGHTLGLAHNYYNSRTGRISVMDYPHPLVTLKADGTLDYGQAYDVGIGSWDKVAIAYGYQDFPAGADEPRALASVLDQAWEGDLRFLSNQDIETTPAADQWSNGTDVAAELERMMGVRRAALARFGERAIKRGMPLATMEEALVPLYLHHRYQVDAAASAVGGLSYVYALRGDGRRPVDPVSGDAQRAALRSLIATLSPAELVLPETLLRTLPPRPMGYGRTRELFPRHTGMAFDVISPAIAAAALVAGNLLDPARAARLVEQHVLDSSLPGLEEVIDALLDAAFGPRPRTPYEAEVARAVQRVAIDQLMGLAAGAGLPQVRAVATLRLERRLADLRTAVGSADQAVAAHAALLAKDITRFLDRPGPVVETRDTPAAPPGAPIGQTMTDWLSWTDLGCRWPATEGN
jgi:Met-zincin/Domain of unknown function (DUF5117)